MIYSYVLFPNHTEGLKLEGYLKDHQIKYTITPTPRELSQCCGISIRIHPEDKGKLQAIVKNNAIQITGIKNLEIQSYFNI